MRAYARKFAGDEEQWIRRPLARLRLRKISQRRGPSHQGQRDPEGARLPGGIRRAILSHADYTGVSRESPMEKALFACDELAGFITATALVKPNKSLAEVDAKSVRKRMKDKAFARSVSREDIVNGAAELGVDLDEHITFCIEAMKSVAGELGLAGR